MTLVVSHDQYIFPPRSSDAVPRDATSMYADLGWIGQLKYNDTHVLIRFTATGKIELWNRHAEKVRGYLPTEELAAELESLRELFGVEDGKVTILDGGLLDSKHVALKDQIVIWDLFVLNDEHLVGTTYKQRFDMVASKATSEWYYKEFNFGQNITAHIHVPLCYTADQWDAQWDKVAEVNEPFLKVGAGPLIEGLVYKDLDGRLKVGFRQANNSHWIGRSRVTTGRHQF